MLDKIKLDGTFEFGEIGGAAVKPVAAIIERYIEDPDAEDGLDLLRGAAEILYRMQDRLKGLDVELRKLIESGAVSLPN